MIQNGTAITNVSRDQFDKEFLTANCQISQAKNSILLFIKEGIPFRFLIFQKMFEKQKYLFV